MNNKRKPMESGRGTHRAYFVEVRSVLEHIFQHPSGFMVGPQWARVPVKVVPDENIP